MGEHLKFIKEIFFEILKTQSNRSVREDKKVIKSIDPNCECHLAIKREEKNFSE